MFSVVNLRELTPLGRKMDQTPIKLTHGSPRVPDKALRKVAPVRVEFTDAVFVVRHTSLANRTRSYNPDPIFVTPLSRILNQPEFLSLPT